jgi:RNA polymerase sigma factor (TIGR02999 family)
MGMSDTELEQLIQLTEAGKAEAREKLFTLLYGELHKIAQRAVRRNSAVTLSPTTLLHETYLNMAGRESAPFADRAHFLAYASRAMRGLIINYVREKSAQKRGGAFEITLLPTQVPEKLGTDLELQKIGDAVESLTAVEPRLARLVDLKFFCGFTFEEIAGVLGISERTAKRDWDKARILLQQYLQDDQDFGE